MWASLRRTIVTGTLAMALAACGGDGNDNGPDNDDPVVGTWSLASLDGLNLPVQVTYQNGTVFVVTSGSALAATEGEFTATYNGTVNGIAAAANLTGTWSKSGGRYVFAGTGAINGISTGASNSTGTLSGNALILDGTPVERWVR